MSAPIPPDNRPILVIKHGALGDFVFALGAMKSIRQHHQGCPLYLLTTPPLATFAQKAGYFDEILLDPRSSFLKDLGGNLSLLRELKKKGFRRIYDLQRSRRTLWYFRILTALPGVASEWSNLHKKAAHFYPLKDKYQKHILDINREQLEKAGLSHIQPPSFEWLQDGESSTRPTEPYFLLVPGCSPSQTHKRWPEAYYVEIARRLRHQGLTPVVIGGDSERELGSRLEQQCPGLINLAGSTSLFDLPSLARHARGALGHDTGPLHIIHFSGCPSLFLFSYSSGPHLCGPTQGPSKVLQSPNLQDLPPSRVWEELTLMQRNHRA